MLWIVLEALIALLLLVGIVVWVMMPQKKGRSKNATPLKPPDVEERRRE